MAMPILFTPPPPKKIVYAYHADYLSMCTSFLAIFDCSFEWGLRTPNLGEREVVGGQRWYRSKERWWIPTGRP